MSTYRKVLFCLSGIIEALPQNKDWLDPDVERMARELLKEPELEPNLTWIRKTGKFESGQRLYLGKWPVGSVYYDNGCSRDDPLKHCATTRLPGMKERQGHYATEQEAMAKAEKVVKYWLGGMDNEPA